MDEELLALWNRLNDPDGEALSDEELETLRAGVLARRTTIDRENPSDEDLAVLEEVRDALASIDEVRTSRASDLARRREDAAAMLAEIEAETPAPDGAEQAAGDVPGGGEAAATAEAAPEATAPAEGAAPEAEATQAAATPAAPAPPARVPSITHLAHRMPNRRPAQTRPGSGPAQLVASADLPGVQAGSVVDLEQWANGVERRIASITKGTNPGSDGERIYFGSIHVEYPEERQLRVSDARGNNEKLDAVTSPQALAASGGICGPVAVDYSVTTIATADRPVRDGMARFGADRGGVQYVKPFTLADVTAAGPATVWTHTNDAVPGSDGAATKAHATFACQPVQTAYVDAIPSIVQFGNFQARYFAEQVEQYLATADAVHARVAESRLLQQMVAASQTVNAGNNGTNQTGAASESLAEIDRIVARFRYVHRMPADSPMHIWYPEWFEDMVRADLARELPGNSGGTSERLAVADAEIDAFFRARSINTSPFLDSPTGFGVLQGWTGLQGIGDASPWPTKVLFLVSHEGAWDFLDGGELNLGMVRDSTLNATNNFQMFSETFENAVFRGHESLAVTMDLCPDGARAAAVDTTALCATGS